MTSRRTWPKSDLLQQRRIALGLPLQPAPVPPLLSLVIKGGIGALVLVLLALLGLQHRQQQQNSSMQRSQGRPWAQTYWPNGQHYGLWALGLCFCCFSSFSSKMLSY